MKYVGRATERRKNASSDVALDILCRPRQSAFLGLTVSLEILSVEINRCMVTYM